MKYRIVHPADKEQAKAQYRGKQKQAAQGVATARLRKCEVEKACESHPYETEEAAESRYKLDGKTEPE